MDKVSSELLSGILKELIKQYPNHGFITDGMFRVPHSNNSELVSSIADILEKISVLYNKTNTTRNSIEGDFDIDKARFYIDNNDF